MIHRPILCICTLFLSHAVAAESVTFDDQSGDDFGQGTLIYPTNPVFRPGVFDLVAFTVTPEGERLRLEFDMAAPVQNEWSMAGGFDVQMFFVFVDSEAGGHNDGLPGLNVAFAQDSGWEKAVVVSPQPFDRVVSEIRKAGALAPDVLAAQDVSAEGYRIRAYVPIADMGSGSPEGWGFQVLVQSNEGFPEGSDLLTRRVNEFEGEYRFGGGNDGNCDPHVVDILGSHEQLAHECGVKLATLEMSRAQ